MNAAPEGRAPYGVPRASSDSYRERSNQQPGGGGRGAGGGGGVGGGRGGAGYSDPSSMPPQRPFGETHAETTYSPRPPPPRQPGASLDNAIQGLSPAPPGPANGSRNGGARIDQSAGNGGRDRTQGSVPRANKPQRICGSCGEPLTGQFVRALDSTFHLECFKCRVRVQARLLGKILGLTLTGLRRSRRLEILSRRQRRR